MVWQDREGYGRTLGLWLISDLLSPVRLIPGCDSDNEWLLQSLLRAANALTSPALLAAAV
jgi:hypothetical protein